jgi:hypothetical protein
MIGSEPASGFEDREISGDWRLEKFDEDGGFEVRVFHRPRRPPTGDRLRQTAVWNLCREAARAVPAQTVNR